MKAFVFTVAVTLLAGCSGMGMGSGGSSGTSPGGAGSGSSRSNNPQDNIYFPS